MKTLRKGLFSRFNGKFRENNTIIVDDSPVKHILNKPENVVLPVSWSHDGGGQSDMFLIDTLLPWLHQLHVCRDVRVAAIVQPRIGQSMLYENPSSEEYLEVKAAIERSQSLS